MTKKQKRETVGKIATDLQQKQPETTSPVEQMQESLTDYEKNIRLAVEHALQKYSHDFYIVVITKKEPLLENVFRNYYLSRTTCPSPDYDQTVYKYDRKNDILEFLWVIPSRGTCFYLRDNALHVAPEEKKLLEYVLWFDNGDLFRLCKKLNGEELESPLLVKG